MRDVALLTGVIACCTVGFAWLALAMDVHWQQVLGATPRTHGVRVRLRALGWIALAVALAFALAVNHASIAVLVWIMALAAAALIVAFTLAWRPRWLGFAVPWVCRSRAFSTSLSIKER